eukprot:ANDGO_00263.mRNA.1 hypothetical protein
MRIPLPSNAVSQIKVILETHRGSPHVRFLSRNGTVAALMQRVVDAHFANDGSSGIDEGKLQLSSNPLILLRSSFSLGKYAQSCVQNTMRSRRFLSTSDISGFLHLHLPSAVSEKLNWSSFVSDVLEGVQRPHEDSPGVFGFASRFDVVDHLASVIRNIQKRNMECSSYVQDHISPELFSERYRGRVIDAFGIYQRLKNRLHYFDYYDAVRELSAPSGQRPEFADNVCFFYGSRFLLSALDTTLLKIVNAVEIPVVESEGRCALESRLSSSDIGNSVKTKPSIGGHCSESSIRLVVPRFMQKRSLWPMHDATCSAIHFETEQDELRFMSSYIVKLLEEEKIKDFGDCVVVVHSLEDAVACANSLAEMDIETTFHPLLHTVCETVLRFFRRLYGKLCGVWDSLDEDLDVFSEMQLAAINIVSEKISKDKVLAHRKATTLLTSVLEDPVAADLVYSFVIERCRKESVDDVPDLVQQSVRMITMSLRSFESMLQARHLSQRQAASAIMEHWSTMVAAKLPLFRSSVLHEKSDAVTISMIPFLADLQFPYAFVPFTSSRRLLQLRPSSFSGTAGSFEHAFERPSDGMYDNSRQFLAHAFSKGSTKVVSSSSVDLPPPFLMESLPLDAFYDVSQSHVSDLAALDPSFSRKQFQLRHRNRKTVYQHKKDGLLIDK